MNLEEITINSKEDLLRACDLLHDAKCTQDDIRYDAVEGTLDIIFKREYLDDPSEIKVSPFLLIFNKFECPLVKSHFHLGGLKSCDVRMDSKRQDVYEFDEAATQGNKHLLIFHFSLEIEVEFQSLASGYLKDLNPVEDETGDFFKFIWQGKTLPMHKEK